jgi:hypothetical protein
MVWNDYMICKCTRDPFNPPHQFEDQGVLAGMELGPVELRQKVVNVENNLRTHQTRQQRCENQEIGNRMDVHKFVRLSNVIYAHTDHCPQKKQ